MLLMAAAAPANASTGSAAVAPTKACGVYSIDKTLTRAQVITRAKSWVGPRVQYDPNGCHTNAYGSYRTDAFGFVSMAWGLLNSRTAGDIRKVTTIVSRATLKPGDALWRGTGSTAHIALFVKWEPAAPLK